MIFYASQSMPGTYWLPIKTNLTNVNLFVVKPVRVYTTEWTARDEVPVVHVMANILKSTITYKDFKYTVDTEALSPPSFCKKMISVID
jgi:hypothetical protein